LKRKNGWTQADEQAPDGMMLDLQVAAVIPVVLDELGYDDPDVAPDRQEAADAFANLVDAAHARGVLALEVSAGDLGSMLVRLAMSRVRLLGRARFLRV
jgi:hypothetical protein